MGNGRQSASFDGMSKFSLIAKPTAALGRGRSGRPDVFCMSPVVAKSLSL
jgi:hypothetical protein